MTMLSKKNQIISLLILASSTTGVSCSGVVEIYTDVFEDSPGDNIEKTHYPVHHRNKFDKNDFTDELPEFSSAETNSSTSSNNQGGNDGSGGAGNEGGFGGDTAENNEGYGGETTSTSSSASSSNSSSTVNSASSSSMVSSNSSSVTSSSSSCGGGTAHKWKQQPVIYVSGQSNATGGWWPLAGVYNSQNILTWDQTDEKWKIAKAELGGEYEFGIGSWAGRLSRKLLDLSIVSSPTIRIKNHGWPGMNLSYFLPNSNEPSKRNPSKNDYAQAKNSWTTSGYEPNVICWAQGEAAALTSKETYYAGLKSLVDAWQIDYPKLEIIVMVKTAEGACGVNTNKVREVQEQISKEYSEISLINLDDLTKNATYHDGCHYTLEGYEIMADRILNKLSSL